MCTLGDQPIVQIYCAQHKHLIDVVHVYRLFSPASLIPLITRVVQSQHILEFRTTSNGLENISITHKNQYVS